MVILSRGFGNAYPDVRSLLSNLSSEGAIPRLWQGITIVAALRTVAISIDARKLSCPTP